MIPTDLETIQNQNNIHGNETFLVGMPTNTLEYTFSPIETRRIDTAILGDVRFGNENISLIFLVPKHSL